MLPTIGGFLAVLGLLAHAQAQTAGADADGQPKVRLLAVATPPLADEQLPDGGVVLALVRAGLGRAGPGAAPESSVKWTSEALTPQLLRDPSVDLSLPVESADCDRPNNLTQSSAALCDSAIFSEPILQVVLSLFTSSNSAFKFDTDQSILGKTICLSRDHDLSALNGNGRNWVSYKRVTVIRRATLLDCVAAVQANDADTFVATDLEGTHLLRRMGLAPYFTLLPRPLATGGIHAVVFRDHARAPDAHRRPQQWPEEAEGGRRLCEHRPEASDRSRVGPRRLRRIGPTQGTVLGLAGSRDQGDGSCCASGAAAAPAPAVTASTPPKAAAAAAPTKADPESRERALKFVKRGGEELAEGRVAPARLLFERAAEMGLAQAAMALAATYDAAELSQPHLRNVLPDPAEARRWYERAHALGAAEAGARLQRLGAR